MSTIHKKTFLDTGQHDTINGCQHYRFYRCPFTEDAQFTTTFWEDDDKTCFKKCFFEKTCFFHLETIKIYFEMKKKQKNAKSLQHPGFPGRLRSKY